MKIEKTKSRKRKARIVAEEPAAYEVSRKHAGTWAEHVDLQGRYQRSVNLERDSAVDGWLEGYLATPLVCSLIERVAAGLKHGGTARAWSLTGPFGSGKSAFAVFLSEVLGIPDRPAVREARALLVRSAASSTKTLFGKGALNPASGLCTVLATGERRPLEQTLLAALRKAILTHWSGRGVKPAVARIEAAERRAASGQIVSSSEVVGLFQEIAEKVRDSDKNGLGLLVVLDEAGKALEYAAATPVRGDIQLLQDLAEAAARSGDAPIVFVVALHQAFDRYASRLSVSQRNEWAKVQGRFEDVAFQEPADQLLRLVGSALARHEVPATLDESARALCASVAALAKLPGVADKKRLGQLLHAATPLHPVTALALGPLFRSRICQNERSLFAFLATTEPKGFQAFLHEPVVPGTLYTLDRLYDYFVEAFGSRLYGSEGHAWAQTEAALHRLPPDATVMDARVVKAVGVLGALGEAVGLSASRPLLELALVGEGKYADRRLIQEAIDRLQRASILVFRKYRDAFQLWEGSDLNVDTLVAEGASQIDPNANLAARLTRIAAPRPIIARRHLFETGTLRYFEVRYADEKLLDGDFGKVEGEADGVVYLALPSGEQGAEKIRNVLTASSTWWVSQNHPIVVAVPNSAERARALALEMAALEWAHANTPQLQGDAVARREVAGRLAETERLLREELSSLLGGSRACDWFHKGDCFTVGSPRELAAKMSDLCDAFFSKAPKLFNELLNRGHLSSAAASARRSLMQAMLERSEEPNLGIEGFPPELSMYRSLLEKHRLHREVDGTWRFAAPKWHGEGNITAAYEAIVQRLETAEAMPLGLADLYATLRRSPYGLKDGPIPVLVLASLLVLQGEVAIYEDGVFVPSLTPALIERLLRGPEKFQLQRFQIAGARADLFDQLLGDAAGRKVGGLLPVVRQLIRVIRDIPQYSTNTRSMSEPAQAVREALLRAREPGPLLFQALPAALGVEPIVAEPAPLKVVEDLVAKLKTALREIQGAYPKLLGTIQREIGEAFGLPSNPELARKELSIRARSLQPLAADTQVKSLLIRAADDALSTDEWLVSMATFLGGRPPEGWHDSDLEAMRMQLAQLARRFETLQAFAIEQNRAAAPEGTTLLRLSVAQPGEAEHERVVAIRPDDEAGVQALCRRLWDTVDGGAADLSRDSVLAALALVAKELVTDLGRGDDAGNRRLDA